MYTQAPPSPKNEIKDEEKIIQKSDIIFLWPLDGFTRYVPYYLLFFEKKRGGNNREPVDIFMGIFFFFFE